MTLLYIFLYKEICLVGIYSWQHLQTFRELRFQKHGFHGNIHIKLSIYRCIRTEKKKKKFLVAELLLKSLAFEPSFFWIAKTLFSLAVHHIMGFIPLTIWFQHTASSATGFNSRKKRSSSYFRNYLLAGITLCSFFSVSWHIRFLSFSVLTFAPL